MVEKEQKENSGGSVKASIVKLSGICPEERGNFACARWTGEEILIHGGNSKEKEFSDFWTLDLKNLEWKKVLEKHNQLCLIGHTATLVPRSKGKPLVIMFGGWRVDPKENKLGYTGSVFTVCPWTKEVIEMDSSARLSHPEEAKPPAPRRDSVFVTDPLGDRAYLIGGFNSLTWNPKLPSSLSIWELTCSNFSIWSFLVKTSSRLEMESSREL